MKVKEFCIGLDNNRTTFVPGQRLEGHISLILNVKQMVQLIRVRFSGSIKTRLYKNDPSNSMTTYIFKETNVVFGTSFLEGPAQELDAGEHVFPFAFRVPPINLPPSYRTHPNFVGPKCKIKYEITAALVRPGGTPKSASYQITIPSSLDASEAQYSEPVNVSVTTEIGKLKKSGTVEITAKIPKKAFYIESTVPLSLSIINQSGMALKLNGIKLKQKVQVRLLNEQRGPCTEKVHLLDYVEVFPSSVRDISRLIQVTLPSNEIMSTSIFAPTIDVVHTLQINIETFEENNHREIVKKWKKQEIKINVPLVICGFPFMALDGASPQQDFLPLYQDDIQELDEYESLDEFLMLDTVSPLPTIETRPTIKQKLKSLFVRKAGVSRQRLGSLADP